MIPLLVLAAVAAPPSSASPEAIALARALHVRPSILLGGDRPEAQAVAMEANQLLHTTMVGQDGVCDGAVPACREAAQRFALETVRATSTAREKASVEMLAETLDARLKPDQMRRLATFAGTPEGQGLVTALLDYDAPPSNTPALRQKYSALMLAMAQSVQPELLATQTRFYEATKDLPRGKLMVPPPIPMPVRK